MSEHPWAGVDVTLELLARDEAGNEGRSTPHEMRLPERIFSKPLARALIEQRRDLALDANAKPRVLTALDALTLAPERFTPEKGIYLGLRSIYWNLTHARTDDQLREVVARLWSMAVTIEDGNISDAEAALRAAQEALRQALERGATDEEIKRLMEQLRAALDRFLQALAEELRKNPQAARPLDRNSRTLRSQDLKSMLDRMERMARSGAKDAAKRLLDELQQMLENLQMARPGGEMDGDDDMMSALDELGDMIRRQEQLRNRTFREGQEQRRQRGGQRGQPQPGDPNSMGELKQDQGALREQLRKLLEELKKRGLAQPGSLGSPGSPGSPVSRVARATSIAPARPWATPKARSARAMPTAPSMRKAVRSRRCARAPRGWRRRSSSRWVPGQAPANPDAWGRRARSRKPTRSAGRCAGATMKAPTQRLPQQRRPEMLPGASPRRGSSKELRRRFGESFRPQLELDYIERLLKDF